MSNRLFNGVKALHHKTLEKLINALEAINGDRAEQGEVGRLRVDSQCKVLESEIDSPLSHFAHHSGRKLSGAFVGGEHSSSDDGFLTGEMIVGLSHDFFNSSMDF